MRSLFQSSPALDANHSVYFKEREAFAAWKVLSELWSVRRGIRCSTLNIFWDRRQLDGLETLLVGELPPGQAQADPTELCDSIAALRDYSTTYWTVKDERDAAFLLANAEDFLAEILPKKAYYHSEHMVEALSVLLGLNAYIWKQIPQARSTPTPASTTPAPTPASTTPAPTWHAQSFLNSALGLSGRHTSFMQAFTSEASCLS